MAVATGGADNISDSIKTCVDAICSHTGWPLGHAYDCKGDLMESDVWHTRDRRQFRGYVEACRTASAPDKPHLAGRARATGTATWLENLAENLRPPKSQAAIACGMRAGLALPVIVDQEAVAVLEFFTDETEKPDESFLQTMTQIGQQLGRTVERKRAYATIRRMAVKDSLTGLANRSQFQRRLQSATAQARRSNTMVALIFLDLDHFKDVNDTLGHPVGDQLLITVAERLEACGRETDTVARLGGDEFAIIATNLNSTDGIVTLAKRVNTALKEPYHIDSREIHSSGSLGITMFPADGEDYEALQKNADLALYRAKEKGRDNFQFFDAEMNTAAQRRKTVEQSLRRAIDEHQFDLNYQPQIDLASGQIIGAEALIRWNHPEHGVITPDEFIPIAEATRQIIPIGEWVLKSACTQAKAWQEQGLPINRIAVNLSAVQTIRAPIAETTRQVLAETGLAPESLELEITESVVMDNMDQVIPVLQELNDLGVSLAIDDFGTGYSSLSYLKTLPVSRLKIDRSFVSDVTSNPDDAAIISAIVAMAQNLRLEITAEGVEQEDQLEFLRGLGCDEVQGYLLGRPAAAQAFVEQIEAYASRSPFPSAR